MYLKSFEICVLNYMSFILVISFCTRISMACSIKKKSNLSTDIDELLMVEKVIRGGICRAICQYVKANNKYKKNYDKKWRIVII